MSEFRRIILVGAAVLTTSFASLVPLTSQTAVAAVSSALTRYPYLTDAVQSSITVNWATDRSAATGSVSYGPPGNCSATTVAAVRSNLSIPASTAFPTAAAEYQWKAILPTSPDTAYCYRIQLATTDLLGSDPSPQFTSQVAAGSTAPFSFAVFGDWGQSYAGGTNPDQANVLRQIADSGARFAVMTGDTAYPGGGQKEYGDLNRPDLDTSTVFGPGFWGVPGRSIPVFNVTGNHGFSNGDVQILNWPEENAASSSGGKYVYEPYGSVNGSTAHSYPSMWYAVDAGPVRIYALTASWADGNIGTGSVYQNDHDAHWTTSSAEYQWLAADLAAHPNAMKIAFWHYPLFADSSGQPGDTFLQGSPTSSSLQGLLDQNHVGLVFNGHAHGYQRNAADAAGLVSYVVGNGGAALGAVSGCTPATDLYAIGTNGSHCGAGPAGLSNDHVYGFVKVGVNGSTVTVTPTDEMGRTYDVQSYTFSGGGTTDTQRPSTPGALTAAAPTSSQVSLTWTASTDNVAVTGYHVYRNGSATALATVGANTTSYQDSTVTAATAYTYQVAAFDAAGNESLPPATVSVTTAPATTSTNFAFSATEDATVDASQPTVALGTATRLTVDNSPVNNSLVKFSVTGLSGCTVTSAKLRLSVGSSANDNSVYGGDVYDTTSGWTQSTVTWNTAPTAGTPRGSIATAVALSTSYLADVTGSVTGNGTISYLIKSTSSDGARYYSTESGSSAQTPQLQVTCAGSGGGTTDTQAPTTPGGLTATAPTSSQVSLNWTASTDNLAVTGYRIYRNGATSPLATVGAGTTSYQDSTVTAATAYTYQVSASDAAGNESPKATASVSTPAASGGSFTVNATEDATVDASQPTVALGTATRLTVDNSPVNYSLIKFDVGGLTGCTISSAKLRLTVGSGTDDKSAYGGDVYDTTSGWTQSTVTWNTAPTAGTPRGSIATAVALSTSYLADVTGSVTGNGTISYLIKSTSSDGARYYSTESGTSLQTPQLQITCQ